MTPEPMSSTASADAGTRDPAAAGPGFDVRLTADQRVIVTDCEHHQLVEAGAGTGKTTLLVAKLLFELGFDVLPGERPATVLDLSQVAAITFTKKAAAEITDRLRTALIRRAAAAIGVERERVAEQAYALEQVAIGTIDSFAARLVRDHGGMVGVETGFEVLSEADAQALHDEVAGDALLAGLRANDPGAQCLAHHFGFTRARGILCDAFEQGVLLSQCRSAMERGELGWETVVGLTLGAVDELLRPHADAVFRCFCTAYERLEARMLADGVADYTSVLLTAARIAKDADVQQAFQERVKLLVVDEHQDTNLAQVELVTRITGVYGVAAAASARLAAAREQGAERAPTTGDGTPERHTTRLILVGDPKQSIYAFRHADVTMWSASWKILNRAGGVGRRLTVNHRSLPTLTRFFDATLGKILGTSTETARIPYEVPYLPVTSSRPEGPAGVEVLVADDIDARAVAPCVAARIRDILDHPDDYPIADEAGVRGATRRPTARDIAILSRKLHGAADHYERELQDRRIGCYVYGGRGLYARPEVQDLAILLRVVAEPHDPHALAAYLRSPFGGVDDLAIAEIAAARSSHPGPRRRTGETLYDVLERAATVIRENRRWQRAETAYNRLEMLRGLRDRVPHDQLLEIAMEDAQYRAFLAGAPDAPAGIRNVEKLLRIVRSVGALPLAQLVQRFDASVRRGEREDEAPLYTPADELITITTVHKAKGLQWPIVFVVGLDDPFFPGLRDDEPCLAAPPLGLVLPLELVFRDERGDIAIPEPSAVWNRYASAARARGYAEAKRLFYVACTRARDRLFLAGGQRTKDYVSGGLHPDLDWAHTKGPERWLRSLFRTVRDSVPGVSSCPYGSTGGPQDRLIVRRGLAAMQVPPAADVPPPAAPTVDASLTPSTQRHWPALLDVTLPTSERNASDGVSALMWPSPIPEQIARLEHRSRLRTDFAASELMMFDRCDWKHHFGYVASLSHAEVEAARRATLVEAILQAERGDILHDYFRLHQDTWTPDERRAAMKRVLRRRRPMADAQAEENLGPLLEQADRYLTSSWYARVGTARSRAHELPFVVCLSDSIRLHGTLDLCFEEPDGARILDFKTAIFNGLSSERLGAVLDAKVLEYEVQAIVYALAAQEVMGNVPVREFVFFFTGAGLVRTLPVTPAWLDIGRARLLDLVGQLRTATRMRAQMERPLWDARRCAHCEYEMLCQPTRPSGSVIGLPHDAASKTASAGA